MLDTIESLMLGGQMVILRLATEEDGKPVRRMVFDVLCEYGVPADPDDSDLDVMEFGSSLNKGSIYIVAETGQQIVGSAILSSSAEGRVKLSKLFLDKGFRGIGLGRAILDRAVSAARNHGYKEVYLCTRERYKEAVSLYERSGWLRGPDQPPPGPNLLYFLPL